MNTTTTHTTYARLGEDENIHGAPLPAVQLTDADTATTGGAAAASDSADPCVINPEAVSGNSFTHTFNKIFTQATGSSSPCGSDEKIAMGIIATIIVLFIAMLIWCCCHKAKGGQFRPGPGSGSG